MNCLLIQEIPEGSWCPPSNDFLMFFLYFLLSTKLSLTYMTQTQSDFKTIANLVKFIEYQMKSMAFTFMTMFKRISKDFTL